MIHLYTLYSSTRRSSFIALFQLKKDSVLLAPTSVYLSINSTNLSIILFYLAVYQNPVIIILMKIKLSKYITQQMTVILLLLQLTKLDLLTSSTLIPLESMLIFLLFSTFSPQVFITKKSTHFRVQSPNKYLDLALKITQ
jgi:hypothetical protein